MSKNDAGCFGKLPFRLQEKLHANAHADKYWADAVDIPAFPGAVFTIDTVRIDPKNIHRSIYLAIAHSLNDVYASNALPCAVSISMSLPGDTDFDGLAAIGNLITKCCSAAECAVGKLHTTRVKGMTTASVAVVGERTKALSEPFDKGQVWIVGSTASMLCLDLISSQIPVRKRAAEAIDGPKKDVSGDGLVGALHQLSLRHRLKITLLPETLDAISSKGAFLKREIRNIYDYGALIEGFSQIENMNTRLFLTSSWTFGPLVCLARDGLDLSDFPAIRIGSFMRGPQMLRIG